MTIIIAEAGVNHNGDENLAYALVDAAKEAGADIVKFQTFKAEKLASKFADKADYQIEKTGGAESQLSMLQKLELSYDAFIRLSDYCKQKDITFMSTAFEEESLNFLVEKLDVKTLKIPSGEITNAPLLLAHARTGREIILSTGMATLDEIQDALGVIAFGLINRSDVLPKSKKDFDAAFDSYEGKRKLLEKVTILHCTSEYPTPLSDVNVRAIDTMREKFGLKTGLSDHSEGIFAAIAAAARGACLVEKHFTLDKSMEGPDHSASLSPEELNQLVSGIRQIEEALGSGKKEPQDYEYKNQRVIRKSVVALKDIEAGEAFSQDNISVMRPGIGVSPFKYWDLLSITADKSYKAGELICSPNDS